MDNLLLSKKLLLELGSVLVPESTKFRFGFYGSRDRNEAFAFL